MRLQVGGIGGIAEASRWRRSPRSRSGGVAAAVGVGEFLDARGRLTHAARVLIQVRLGEGVLAARIAAELGVHRSTVARELRRGGGRYRAALAQADAERVRARSTEDRRKLRPGTRLRGQVVAWLDLKLSPEQISGRLRVEFGDDESMQVSHETIYQALYVQGYGSLRHELGVVKALRSGRAGRKPRSKLPPRPGRSWVGEAVIANRPAEVADRAVPGHWEGDLIIGGGANLASALITLVERTSRFTLIQRLDVHDSMTVTDRLTLMAGRLPVSLWRSLTWDQGVEMAEHARFSIATTCPVFFCDPHSPWQRPSNENTNGLIRDFFPKGTNFSTVTDAEVAHAEHLLNIRPRKILGFATPAERLDQLLTVAQTA